MRDIRMVIPICVQKKSHIPYAGLREQQDLQHSVTVCSLLQSAHVLPETCSYSHRSVISFVKPDRALVMLIWGQSEFSVNIPQLLFCRFITVS